MHASLSLTPSPLFHLHSQVAGQKKKEKERDQRIQLSYWNKEGWLEIMLDRQLVRDDGCGLGQELMDNRPMNVVFHILVESNISTTLCSVSNPFPLSPSLLSHRVGAHLKKKKKNLRVLCRMTHIWVVV